MNRHRRALQQIAEARPAVLDGAPDRPAPHFPDVPLRRAPRPRHRLALAGLVPTVAAAAIGIAVVLSTSDSASDPRPPQTQAESPTARSVLLAAAAQTATGTQPAGTYWITKTEQQVRYDVGGYTVLARIENETWHALNPGVDDVSAITWLGAAPATAADEAAWKQAGSPTSWESVTPDGRPGRQISAAARDRKVEEVPPFGFALLNRDLTYADVQALPTDPGLLKAYLSGLDPRGVDDELLFSLGTQILTQLPVSPQVRAAVYRMLAEVPGLTITPSEQDAKGRTGVGVTHGFRNSDGSTYEVKLIIDPQSGDLLATADRQGSTLRLGDRFSDEAPPKS
ncbi:MAG: CU044_5270 family protein [Hamadaea sp.]|nr:CU044_5270 family protein [Hamadaea sp.]